ncbi:hypothetical protein Bpfe_009215 [Biomphalaria pfeifferi]|uniref:Uncharacterized protein n=1 Tax=Biomphalaria pfeifferi TaxID=112525 RepID=A0AAD8BV22_BIOPF|nr:hypothetical protein Bpfe_009215 [Biomphalaria pfeifferi]
MDKMSNSFAPVWQTSSSQRADDGNVILEGLKITLDFPLVKETNVSSMLTSPDQLAKSRDTEALALRVSASTSTESSKEKKTGDVKDITTLDKIILACDHFSELSTFHGMRLLCSRGPNPVRRFIWSLLIVGCLVALALQVRQQVLYFFSNPKTINEETKFVDSVEFPTVTICNENAFRISAAYNLKLYDILNNMFNSTLTLDIVAEAGLINLTLDELNYLGGNDIHNMILKCKWNAAETCGPENFTRMITDQGLCYSFNGPTSPRNLTVETPGASRGLQLTLNIEEYERMMGSHVASGIHILIHNRREYPLVEQLGQAIAAGSHTFVALKLKKETRLGYPYDNCQDGLLLHVPNDTYTYTMPACKIECYVEFTLKKCGCRDYYMPGNSPVCTFKEYVSCLRTVQKTYDALEDKICECSTPCTLENVEVSYSYGALSKLATSKIKKDDLDKILGRFKRALDVTEYISSEKSYKKILYENFTDFSSRVKTLYDVQLSSLSRLQQVSCHHYETLVVTSFQCTI